MILHNLLKNKFTYLVGGYYLLILTWWLSIQLEIDSIFVINTYLFNWSYGLIALFGFFYGLYIAYTKWGGNKSLLGMAIIYLALGLLGQWFGLQVWTYYNVIAKVEVPYPSLADVGYFALIPAYTYAAFLFARVAGARFSLKTLHGKALVLIIPIVTLSISYFLFLRDIGFDSGNLVETFFNFGYPLGEIIPAAISIFTLYLCKGLLGGRMKHKIIFLICAFFFQFITEYTFLYQFGKGIYTNAGVVDLMYATSYFIMVLVLIVYSNYD